MTKLLDKFGLENLEHPPHRSDMAPADFHLFPKNERVLGWQTAEEEAKGTVVDRLNGRVVTDCYDEVLAKLVQLLDNSLNCNGDYVEKEACIVSSSDIKTIWMSQVFFLFITKWLLL
jgi:hypothetical protein